MVEVPVLLLASKGICLFCVPFSPRRDSCLPARTAPPATWHQSLLCTHMTKVKTSRNLLLFTKTKPKKVSKGQTTPDHSSQVPIAYLNALFPHYRTRCACFQGITHPYSHRASPLQLLCPVWVEEQAMLPATSPRKPFLAFPERTAPWRIHARFLLLLKLFFFSG